MLALQRLPQCPKKETEAQKAQASCWARVCVLTDHVHCLCTGGSGVHLELLWQECDMSQRGIPGQAHGEQKLGPRGLRGGRNIPLLASGRCSLVCCVERERIERGKEEPEPGQGVMVP